MINPGATEREEILGNLWKRDEQPDRNFLPYYKVLPPTDTAATFELIQKWLQTEKDGLYARYDFGKDKPGGKSLYDLVRWNPDESGTTGILPDGLSPLKFLTLKNQPGRRLATLRVWAPASTWLRILDLAHTDPQGRPYDLSAVYESKMGIVAVRTLARKTLIYLAGSGEYPLAEEMGRLEITPEGHVYQALKAEKMASRLLAEIAAAPSFPASLKFIPLKKAHFFSHLAANSFNGRDKVLPAGTFCAEIGRSENSLLVLVRDVLSGTFRVGTLPPNGLD
jgi:hypothetical protein